ncbi:hypothetical protein ACROYT_G001075 [Oculina patagonica]
MERVSAPGIRNRVAIPRRVEPDVRLQSKWGFVKENRIVVLPVGTTNARFRQRRAVYNMLGIKDHLTGQFIIKLPSGSKTVYYKGTRIEYRHSGRRSVDSIVVDGPTKVPLRLLVSKQNNDDDDDDDNDDDDNDDDEDDDDDNDTNDSDDGDDDGSDAQFCACSSGQFIFQL